MSKKITIKQAQEFVKKFTEKIVELGAKSIKSNSSLHTSFELDTIAGKLNINLPIPTQHNFVFTVFSCFDNVDEAKKHFSCNPFSGKYNFHAHTEPVVPSAMVDLAMIMFRNTLPK